MTGVLGFEVCAVQGQTEEGKLFPEERIAWQGPLSSPDSGADPGKRNYQKSRGLPVPSGHSAERPGVLCLWCRHVTAGGEPSWQRKVLATDGPWGDEPPQSEL